MKKKRTLVAFLCCVLFVWHCNAQSLLNDNGVVNSYQVNYPANFSAGLPPAGIMFTFKVKTGNTNTGSSDLKLNSFSAYPILKNGSTPVQTGDIKSDAFVTVIFDGANWQMLSVGGNPNAGTVSNVSGTLPISVATGTTTPIISISQATSVANGYLTSTDWNTFNNKLSNGATAAGDLAGTYPNPTVAKLNGNNVAATVPASGQFMYFNTGSWQPGSIGGDLTGTFPNPTVANLAITTAKIAASAVDLTTKVNGTLPVANGGTGASVAFSSGSVVFAGTGGVYKENNANFLWDDLNGRLGIGTNTPLTPLHVVGNARITGLVGPGLVQADATGNLTINATSYVTSAAANGSVPYMNSGTLQTSPIKSDASYVAIGNTPQTNYLFRVDQPVSTFPAIYGLNSVAAGTAIWGYNSNVTAGSIGVKGQSVGAGTGLNGSNTGAGYGVYGSNSSTGYAGYFQQSSTGYAAAFMGGNVGIGTSNPSGDLSFGANSGGSRIILVEDETISNPGTSFYIQAGGARAAVLNAVGGDLILASGKSTGSAGSTIVFQTPTPGGSGTADNVFSDKMVILGNGRVGVGTATPSASLHVYKNAFSGILLDQDGTNTLSEADLDIATLGTGNLPIANAGTKGWRFAAYSNANSLTANQNDMRLNVYNGILPTPVMYFESGTGNVGIYTNSAVNKLDVGGNMAVGIGFAAISGAPSNGLIIEGTVGIGTAAPLRKLDVRGTNAGGTDAPQETLIQAASTDVANPLSIGFGVKTGLLAVNRYAFIEAKDIVAQELIIQPSGGNVGIGTTAPGTALAVTGAITVDNASTNDGTSGLFTSSALRFGSGAGEGIASKKTAGGNQNGLDFWTSTVNRMSITNVGNVGIGTSAPALKLDVRGSNATATTAIRENILQIGASDVTTPLVVRVGVKTDATATNRYGFMEVLDIGPENLIFQPQNGNVGIGTTNVPPNARLAIRDGHLQSQQTTPPTFTPGTGAGSTPTISLLNATDVAGTISVTMGTAPTAAANVCTINFNKSYTTPPIVVLTPANAISAQTINARQTFTTSATGGFTITFGGTAATAGNVYIWNYFIIETQ